MATQQEYTAVANALVKEAHEALDTEIAKLPGFAQSMARNFITASKISAACGAAAKTAVDILDAYRSHPTPTTARRRKLK